MGRNLVPWLAGCQASPWLQKPLPTVPETLSHPTNLTCHCSWASVFQRLSNPPVRPPGLLPPGSSTPNLLDAWSPCHVSRSLSFKTSHS